MTRRSGTLCKTTLAVMRPNDSGPNPSIAWIANTELVIVLASLSGDNRSVIKAHELQKSIVGPGKDKIRGRSNDIPNSASSRGRLRGSRIRSYNRVLIHQLSILLPSRLCRHESLQNPSAHGRLLKERLQRKPRPQSRLL